MKKLLLLIFTFCFVSNWSYIMPDTKGATDYKELCKYRQ